MITVNHNLSISALRSLDPSLTSPLDSEPKRERARRQSYSEIERTTALMAASLVGVAKASDDLGIPKRTIYEWLEEAGGIGPMGDAARAALGATAFATVMGICAELEKRLPTMNVKELLHAMKVLTASAAKSLAEDSGQGGAAPTNTIQVVIHETGEVIDLN